MIKLIFNDIIWRELQRQKKLKKKLLIEIFLTTIIIGSYMYTQKKSDKFIIYIPFIYTFIIQYEVFFSDLNNSIETFLSIPISINKILLKKSMYILIVSLILALITVGIFYFIGILNLKISFNLNYIVKIINFLFLLFFLNYFIGNMILILGKRLNILINIIQSVMFFIIILLSIYNNAILCNIILIIVNLTLSKIISKENIIKRSL